MTTKIKTEQNIYKRICRIIEEARHNLARSVNFEMVKAYWLIGKEIVEEEQKGEKHASYGDYIIKNLSVRLSGELGEGFSEQNLRNFRQFYLMYKDREIENLRTVRAESDKKIRYILRSELSWSHYRILMRVEKPLAKSFYEVECIKNNWSARELERQKGSLLFERLALSKDKKAVMRMARKGQEIQTYKDMIKDPYVLEFTGLSPQTKLYESKLEQAVIDNLSRFLLELGKGFTFVGRQKRISLDGDHFYIDLVFYNTILRCYVLLDLKIGKLLHQDIGQMQMYVNYYDREMRRNDDNPTVGLILCEDKKDAVVKYTLSKENRQIFASRYKLYLPTEQELIKELERERKILGVKV